MPPSVTTCSCPEPEPLKNPDEWGLGYGPPLSGDAATQTLFRAQTPNSNTLQPFFSHLSGGKNNRTHPQGILQQLNGIIRGGCWPRDSPFKARFTTGSLLKNVLQKKQSQFLPSHTNKQKENSTWRDVSHVIGLSGAQRKLPTAGYVNSAHLLAREWQVGGSRLICSRLGQGKSHDFQV